MMTSAEKLRNIVREAMRAFIDETGLIPRSLEFNYLERKVAPGAIPPKVLVEAIDIEIILRKSS